MNKGLQVKSPRIDDAHDARKPSGIWVAVCHSPQADPEHGLDFKHKQVLGVSADHILLPKYASERSQFCHTVLCSAAEMALIY